MSIALGIIYLIATVTFIIGLKMLGHPATAKKGNLISGAGMVLAIIGTLFLQEKDIVTDGITQTVPLFQTVSIFVYSLIIAAIILGSIIGWFMAMKVEMTKMPELVSLFNGF